MTPQLLLLRQQSDKHRTHGDLFLDGDWECFTLEDVVRADPDASTQENEAKIPGETAIPAGIYELELVDSPHFGPDTISLKRVPGYVDVRIHAGNTEADTRGCLIVGQARADASVLHSRAALAELKAKVVPRLKAGEKMFIEIKDAA